MGAALSRSRWRRVSLAAVLAALGACAPVAAAEGARRTTSPTPYMGVNTWYAFGANVDEEAVVQLTNAVAYRRLKAAGYRYVWIDAGWWHGDRDADGHIVVDPALWPHGL